MSVCEAADMRCPLFIPGNRGDMLLKARRYSPSAYIPDLEDSVPASHKSEALEIVCSALPDLAATGRAVIPRVNSLATGRTETELEAIVSIDIAGISIGKIGSADDIREVDGMLSKLEVERGLRMGRVEILPWIESASAILMAYDICVASDRVRWVAFGAEDYSADMGIARAVDIDADDTGRVDEYGEAGLLYARSAVAVAARAARVVALDTPYVRFRDEAGLRREAGLARRLGYGGKFAIHPAQLDAIESVFAPSESEILRARKVVEAAEAAARDGRGSIDFQGEMVDEPVLARARNVLLEANRDK